MPKFTYKEAGRKAPYPKIPDLLELPSSSKRLYVNVPALKKLSNESYSHEVEKSGARYIYSNVDGDHYDARVGLASYILATNLTIYLESPNFVFIGYESCGDILKPDQTLTNNFVDTITSLRKSTLVGRVIKYAIRRIMKVFGKR